MITSNQHYGALNKRFDRRAILLRKLGWKYTELVPGVAGFVRSDWIRIGRTQAIPASLVQCADNRTWWDELSHQLRRY
jgi:hypothetical protein